MSKIPGMASIDGPFLAKFIVSKFNILVIFFCRDFWRTAAGCSWYFDAVFKLSVYGEHTRNSSNISFPPFHMPEM